jgi:cyclopropane fatty-acyl-phospholipid synthase-like methyltransferase
LQVDMLELYTVRAQLPQLPEARLACRLSVIDLGCGWGSLSVYLAER